jgi:hypothetical protein
MCKSCAAKALADELLGILKDAAHDGTPFAPVTGLLRPAEADRPPAPTW